MILDAIENGVRKAFGNEYVICRQAACERFSWRQYQVLVSLDRFSLRHDVFLPRQAKYFEPIPGRGSQ
jgi:hypothetical protein